MPVLRLASLLRVVLVASSLAAWSAAQSQAKAKAPKDSGKTTPAKVAADRARAATDSGKVSVFFRSEEPITVTLTTNIKRIRGDKSADAPWRPATWTFTGGEGVPVVMPIRIKTRGIWRLKTCEFPPIRLNFTSEEVKRTPFHGLDKPKLVNYCRNSDEYERYILQELQLYRIYHVLTPVSHAVRLIRLTYADSASGKVEATRYAFIEEEPEAMAARVGGSLLKITGAAPDDLEPVQDAIVGLFQYLIGNTDFALGALHNAELLGLSNGNYTPVVHDFDFAGAVNARYAVVDARLPIHTVRNRLYRGYCVPPDTYPGVIARFNAAKDSLYALYRDPIGALLPPDVVKSTLEYFDEFYRTINDPRVFKRDIIEACVGRK